MTLRGIGPQLSLAAVALVASAACSRSSSDAPRPAASGSATALPGPEAIAQARDAARQFFLAADAGDCPALTRMRRDGWTDEACEDFVHHYKANRTRLTELSDAKPDGRNRSVILVTALLEMPGKDDKPHRWVLPIEKRADGWKVGYW